MKAGLDIGTSLVKAAWNPREGVTRFLSTADMELVDLFDRLDLEGITHLVITGDGQIDIPALFAVRPCQANHLTVVTRGVLAVMPATGHDLDSFLVVDLGNSFKYCLYRKKTGRTTELPFRNPIGGGWLQGISRLLTVDSLSEVGQLAKAGAPPDILAKDLDLEMAGTVGGTDVIAHFALAEAGTPMEDACAGLLQMVAASIVRDFKFQRHIIRMAIDSDFKLMPPIFPVGTLANRLPELALALKHRLGLQLFFPIFLPHAEYAAALGALLEPES
jgi:hypothetical protein